MNTASSSVLTSLKRAVEDSFNHQNLAQFEGQLCARALAYLEHVFSEGQLDKCVRELAGDLAANHQTWSVKLAQHVDLLARRATTKPVTPVVKYAKSIDFPFLEIPQAPGELGRLGAFRILHKLGKGGMGVVFEAEELELQRRVAIKVMLEQSAADTDSDARFLREAQIAAHPSRAYSVLGKSI